MSDISWRYYWDPWWREMRTYFTPLSVAECRRILTESTTRFLGRRVRRALFSPVDFTLSRVVWYRNDLKPVAYIKLREVPGRGALVLVTLSGWRSGQVFWVVWFGFLAVFALISASDVVKEGATGLWGPLFGSGMAAFGLLLNAFGRFLGRSGPAFLLGFLQEHLRLTEPPGGIELLVQP